MIFSNFRVNVLFRVVFIGLLIGLAVTALFKTGWVVTPIVIFIMVGFAITDLVRYVEKTNKEFSDFLLYIKNADFSKYNETDDRGKSFAKFKKALNIIIDEFQHARIDKEAHYTFLKTVLGHLDTAIISYNDKGEIKLINEAAKKLLNIPFLDNINYLQKINPALYQQLTTGNNEILELDIMGQQMKLLLRATDFRIQGMAHRIVLAQNIKTEIEHTEVEAWEQLLHVLTHEIMNSITPISSLSGTIKSKMDSIVPGQHIDADTFEDMSYGLQVIANRSVGLMNFVNHYKSLITLPPPNFTVTSIASLFERVGVLTKKELAGKKIELRLRIKGKDLSGSMDTDLIEQVLLNLVNNAADALEATAQPYIELSAELQNNIVIIRVTDNGAGIDKAVLGKIFIPFFTTRKKGTGIGLSLSKQIMRMHNGSINVNTIAGQGTVFSLEFP